MIILLFPDDARGGETVGCRRILVIFHSAKNGSTAVEIKKSGAVKRYPRKKTQPTAFLLFFFAEIYGSKEEEEDTHSGWGGSTQQPLFLVTPLLVP